LYNKNDDDDDDEEEKNKQNNCSRHFLVNIQAEQRTEKQKDRDLSGENTNKTDECEIFGTRK